jgi:chitinase
MIRNRLASTSATKALMGLLVLAMLVPAGLRPSEAVFVAASANPGAQFTAAADFNTVAVTLTNPGSPLKGSVPLTAAAASNRGITSVVFSTAPAGTGTWTVACTKIAAPYTCTFDTTTVADGLRDVRAVATDSAGYSRTDTVTDRRVDNTAPTATTTDPGSPLTGNVTIAGTAADAGSGLASVSLEYRLGAGAWTNICTQATSPISCSWNTAPLADGLYDLRTVATDVAGNQTISAPVFNRRVDNTAPTVSITDPGAALKGSITLASTTADGLGSGVVSVRYEYKLTSGGAWTTACTGAATPFSCAFNTASLADNLYDFRAVATDGVAKVTTSTAVTSRRIDNTAPAVPTLGAVATPIQGTVALTGTASDTGSGVASLRFQYAVAGSGSWSDACTDVATPYTCSFDTTVAADGLYDMRTLATDNAGNTTASVVQTNRRIDNDGPVVAVTSPLAGPVHGAITFGGTATDGVGVTTTTFEYRQGAGAWTTTCTDTTAPYSCAADTTGVTDGVYDLRMRATDTLGHSSTSAVVTITVDNTAPTATNVQAFNGGTAGRIDAGDTVAFTWSEPMAPVSILAGWSGTSQAIRVRINNAGATDTLDLYNAAGTTRLNVMSATQALRLQANYVSATTNFNATMVMSGNTVTITIGTLITGTIRTGVVTTANMIWSPSTAASDVVGNPAAATAATETGALDRDF